MKISSLLSAASFLLVIIGSFNWGFVGLANINIVDLLLGVNSWMSKIVYMLVGGAGLFLTFNYFCSDNIRQ